MLKDFYTAIKERRSIYGISKERVVSDERIRAIVENAVTHVPSSFNSQSGRVLLLLGEHHDKLWETTKEILRQLVPTEQFAATEEKINGFKNGYGSVLFFEDESVIEGLQHKFALYKDNFPLWSQHSSGMLQFVVWTALEGEGFGASLQHYNPLIDAVVKKQWQIPDTWKLIAEMPFGKPTVTPDPKQFAPLEQRIKVFR
ncbi:nitroreductase [Lucifera butyrica]|uniref:Nitroreductase n=1 Tax=Lucifera butyrica TaxID=1351585 RepID=A0A498R102_9FIRM|nr:nitroreductase family protein [Lucifera butyrica]VBB05001.1 nitroreductase [Lucifera butyrica]